MNSASGMVSVIIPIFNMERYLPQALESLQWQTYSNWECLLIDDGSTDRSADIFRHYAAKDARLKYHRQDNAGPSAARNLGIALACGQYIQFLDADDVLLPDRFRLCVELLEHDHDVDAVYTDYITFQRGRGYSRNLPARMPHNDAVRSLLFENNRTFVILIHSWMFRSAIVRRHPFDVHYRSHAEDIECWVRMAVNGVRFKYLDSILAVYRSTPNSLGSDEVSLLASKIDLLDKYRDHPVCGTYPAEYNAAVCYLRQRLAIGYFMARLFNSGWQTMRSVWRDSSWSARMKMSGWCVLMLVMSKQAVASLRHWVVRHTPFRWGAWKQLELWTPSAEIKTLLHD